MKNPPSPITGRTLRQKSTPILFAIALAGAGSQTLWAQPEANPGRPTVSNPATLTPVGYLQLESGALGADHSGEFDNRTALEEVAKLTVAPRLELLVQTEPVVHSNIGSAGGNDPGGVALGFQFMLMPGKKHRPTISAGYFRSIYDGTATDLDIGSNRQSALLLVSTDLGKFHVDTNYIFNEQIDHPVRRLQYGQTLSISHPIAGKFGYGMELWHFTQPFLKSNAAGLLTGPTWTVRPNLVLDAGFNRGLTGTSTRWEFFAGVTYVIPKKLW